MKACTKCGIKKPLTDYFKNAAALDGLKTSCKVCSTAQTKSWVERNRERVRSKKAIWKACNPERERSYQLKIKFDLTSEEYESLWEEQDGRCAICRLPERIKGRRLAVDHCHSTLVIRGLLCFHCNTSVGKLEPFWSSVKTYLDR